MVATGVAARGLDIEKVSLAVNYDMPTEIDSYIPRIHYSYSPSQRLRGVLDPGQTFHSVRFSI